MGSVNNLAVLLMDMGQVQDALPMLERAERIARVRLGSKHPQYATTLNNLGGGLRSVGRTSEARARFKRALRINRKALGDSHANTKNTRSNLKALPRSDRD